METTLAVMERQQQFDFQKNGIEVMNFETLQRTYKENDIYNNPVQGIYHYQVIRRMMDICEKYNLDYEVEEIFAAQNRNKTQPGVSILPQVEQTHGEKAVEAHILRRIFATIRIRGLGDRRADNHTGRRLPPGRHTGSHRPLRARYAITSASFHRERSVCNYGKKKVSTEEVFETVDGWLANFEVNMNEDIERIQRLKRRIISDGGNLPVHRSADRVARFPRQFGQKPVILCGNLPVEPEPDFCLHGRGAETGHEQRTDYRMGPVQCSH